MSVVALAGSDASQQVVNAVVEFVHRFGRAPRVVLGLSDDDLRITLAEELRVRGFEVREAAHARTLHGALMRAIETPLAHAIDLFVVDSSIDGCSPLHAIGYARQRGVTAATILLAEEDDHVRTESSRLDLVICARRRAVAEMDQALLGILGRRWSHRAVAA